MSQLSSRAAEYLLADACPGPLGSASASTAPHQAFRCLDGQWLAVGVETDQQFDGLCRALRRTDLLEDPGYHTNVDRVARRHELAEALAATIACRPTSWWGPKLERFGVPHGRFLDFEALRHHQQVVENAYMVEMDIPHQGRMAVGGLPWEFSADQGNLYSAPAPGEHTKAAMEQGFGLFGPRPFREPRFARPLSKGEPPLHGLRVLDLSRGLCGPYASLLLADAGAHIVKIEPPEGDHARGFAPRTATGSSAVFELLNRNKQSVVLDLTRDEGRLALRKLAGSADVIIEDLGVGRAGELGVDYASLRADNPSLVYCAITAFGERGPLARRSGSELVLQAMTDYCHSLGSPGGPPVRWGSDIGSLSTGGMACLGILAALYRRNATGVGQRVAISLFGTLMLFREASWSVLGDVDEWEGPFVHAYTNPRMHGWRTRDRDVYVRLHRAQEEDYFSLLIDLDLEDVLADDRFADVGRHAVGNGRYAVEVAPIWERATGVRTSREVSDIVRARNGMAVPFNTLPEALDHAQVESIGILRTIQHPLLGRVRMIGAPFGGPWVAPELAPAPRLGEHTGVSSPWDR